MTPREAGCCGATTRYNGRSLVCDLQPGHEPADQHRTINAGDDEICWTDVYEPTAHPAPGQTAREPRATAASVADLLHRTVADLDGYIQRRAEELAAPLVEAARAEAAERVAAMATQVQHHQDVADELRRIIAVRDRQLGLDPGKPPPDTSWLTMTERRETDV